MRIKLKKLSRNDPTVLRFLRIGNPSCKLKVLTMNEGEIIIIDDDVEDLEIIESALHELNVKNTITYLNNAETALQYLTNLKEPPCFILCDINMPKYTGIEIRELINNIDDLQSKLTPFLFWSTSDNNKLVEKAYALNIQGFFQKPNSIVDLKKMINVIIDYWKFPTARTIG